MYGIYQKLIYTSFFTRCILATIVGFFSKIITIPVFFVHYFFIRESLNNTRPINDAVALSASNISHGKDAFDQAVSILILAPTIENLVIPFVFWALSKFKNGILFSIILITFISYHYHAQGSQQITGAVFFFCYAVFYARIIKVCGKLESYILTVIAHFVTNLIAFSFMLQH